MAIETNCPGCGQKLRVGDEHAGKTARCPTCKTLYTVPRSTTAAGAEAAEGREFAPRTPQAQTTAKTVESAATAGPARNWRLKTESGQVYGPVSKSDLDAWVAQGRVTPDAELQQDGDAFWQRAATMYPELALSRGPLDNPFADYGSQATNPYQASQAYGVSTQTYADNHRGVLILILGLLTWILGCPILGPIAAVMGIVDLRKMNEGTMDPGGKGLTIAGMVLGGIYTLLMVLVVVFIAFAAMLD